MESWKNCKSVVTEDGITLTYCEFGEENEEVIISGAFFHHTWLPVEEMLGEKYHVYGIVMRFGDGKGTQLNEDGTIHWTRQWGDDVYKLAKALGIEKFHYLGKCHGTVPDYLGKCHGTVPGWYMVKNHPEMIQSLGSFFLAPHLLDPDNDEWTRDSDGPPKMEKILKNMRHSEIGLSKKMAEMKSITEIPEIAPEGYGNTPPELKYYLGTEILWDTREECEQFLETMPTPVCFMFGSDDALFHDYETSNMYTIQKVNRAKTVFLQGERHLMELDIPERIASEADFFIQECKKNYI